MLSIPSSPNPYLPQSEQLRAEDTYKLMGTASDRGIDLANAFGASMGHPESLRMGMSNETNRQAREDSQYYAQTAMELARELSERGK